MLYRIASEVFEDACKTFGSTLSEDQRRAFKSYPTASHMLDSIKQLVEEDPVHQNRLTKVFRRIKSFASRLDPFFEIVNTFIQVNSQYSGLAWGAIQLVFAVRPQQIFEDEQTAHTDNQTDWHKLHNISRQDKHHDREDDYFTTRVRGVLRDITQQS
jgi:hypothetical protein